MDKIFVFGFNRPDLLEYQFNSIKNNIVGEHKFYLVYDHLDEVHTKKFEEVCYNYGIDVYDHLREKNFGNSQNHASSMQWIFDNHLEDNDRVLFLDHDIFLIDKFNFNLYFNTHDIIGHITSSNYINFLWPGIFGFKFDKIKNYKLNFYPGVYKNVYLDTFGYSYKLLEDNNLSIGKFFHEHIESMGEFFDLFDKKFVHLYGGSKWHENFTINSKDFEREGKLFKLLT